MCGGTDAQEHVPPVVAELARRVRQSWSIVVAERRMALEPASREAKDVARKDVSSWLEQRATEFIVKEASAGRMDLLWNLARRLAGKKRARGPRTVPVLKKADGTPPCSPEEVAVVWKKKFAGDFGSDPRGNREAELASDLEGVRTGSASLLRRPQDPNRTKLLAQMGSLESSSGMACLGFHKRVAEVLDKCLRGPMPLSWKGGRKWLLSARWQVFRCPRAVREESGVQTHWPRSWARC